MDTRWLFLGLAGLTVACGEVDTDEPRPEDVAPTRAYVVSLESDELTIIDLDRMEVEARVSTGGVGNHMVALARDGRQAFVTSSDSDQIIVVDTEALDVTDRVPVNGHPTHLMATPDGRHMAIMEEGHDGLGSVALLGIDSHTVEARIQGVTTPHFMRFSPDGHTGYVANITGNFITQVDMDAFEVRGRIAMGDMDDAPLDHEGGFADAQIDAAGVLYAAHHDSGRVLVYDTVEERKLDELTVGEAPWVAFAAHPFSDLPLRHVVPNLGDRSVSVIDGDTRAVLDRTLEGDEEAYGVNFSPLTPGLAFVMLRVGRGVEVIDTERQERLERIDVGGNVETASTTPDGRHIVAAVSDANEVVVVDPVGRRVVKRFSDVGVYPWAVAVPGGQNYCH